MWRGWVDDYLIPKRAEANPEFRRELDRLSHMGLLVIGGAQISVALFMFLARFVVSPDPATFEARMRQSAIAVALGVLCLVAARIPKLYCRSRHIALFFGIIIAAVLIWSSMSIARLDPSADDYIPGQVTLVVLVGVVAIPLRPAQTLLFGLSIAAIYGVLASLARASWSRPPADPVYLLFFCMLTLLATGLSSVLYAQRWRMFEDAEYMRQAQSRILLAENAALVGRLAAALSHELNSPIGALVSGVDTLLLLAARQATCAPDQQQRLVVLQNDLRKTVRESAKRLQELVARMQRFTNLDKAEVQEADVNLLVRDVAALLDPKIQGSTEVRFQLGEVPPVVCRPQQISAALGEIMNNALDAVDGTGHIDMATRRVESQVEIRVSDNGRGVPPEELKSLFDPHFKVRGNRVASGNWSLFSSRQIVREHGGDIRIESAPGVGTSVIVMLPLAGSEQGPAPLT